jgi:hypothetical protein
MVQYITPPKVYDTFNVDDDEMKSWIDHRLDLPEKKP